MKHLALCISAWTRRLKSDELDQLDQQQLRIAALLHQRKCHKVRGLRDLSSDINGNRKHHDQVKHLGLVICDWTKRLESHRHVGSYIHAYVCACITTLGVLVGALATETPAPFASRRIATPATGPRRFLVSRNCIFAAVGGTLSATKAP